MTRVPILRPTTMTKKRTLTDDEWRQVFTARCRSKRGERITDEERSSTGCRLRQRPQTVPGDGARRVRRDRAFWLNNAGATLMLLRPKEP